MKRTRLRVTLVATRVHAPSDIHEELQWLGNTLGLFSERDKEKSCFRIFIELVKGTKRSQMLTSDELAFRLNLARGTVVHHLNKLIDAHIVVPHRSGYTLRHEKLEKMVEQIEDDATNLFKQLKAVATNIDQRMNTP